LVEEHPHPQREALREGIYCLVRYSSKKSISYFVGCSQGNLNPDDTVTVKFLQHLPSKKGTIAFIKPAADAEELDDVNYNDIILLLPEPVSCGGTKRVSSRLVFNGTDLSDYF